METTIKLSKKKLLCSDSSNRRRKAKNKHKGFYIRETKNMNQ